MVKIKTYHFYHIYAGAWHEPVRFHFEMLKKHGLLNRLDGIYIGIVGPASERNNVINYLNTLEIPYTIVDQSREGWEQITQNKLHEFAQHHDGYVLYAHTKGSANPAEHQTNWRMSMTYFTVVKWKNALKKLKNHDAVGCYWIDASNNTVPGLGGPHVNQKWFAGTFWWSKLELLRTIPPPQMGSRWDAEVWIGKIPNINIFDFDRGRPAGAIIDPDKF